MPPPRTAIAYTPRPTLRSHTPSPPPLPQASDAQKLEIESQRLRLATVDAIEAAVADAAGNRAASVAAVVEQIKGSSAKDVAAAKALLQTL